MGGGGVGSWYMYPQFYEENYFCDFMFCISARADSKKKKVNTIMKQFAPRAANAFVFEVDAI